MHLYMFCDINTYIHIYLDRYVCLSVFIFCRKEGQSHLVFLFSMSLIMNCNDAKALECCANPLKGQILKKEND